MNKLSIPGESSSSSTAHKLHASTVPRDEGPIPSLSVSSSLDQAASSPSIPNIPLDLISHLILPFVADRVTWNSMYSASKELYLAGKKMTPPWPNTTLNVGHVGAVRNVAFSPSNSQLAFDITYQYIIHVWDRWGKETLLAGHTSGTLCLEYSSDGEYLASGSHDIRIWHTKSFHATCSKTSKERQAETILLVSRYDRIIILSFSRTDSNILASGGSHGEIKVWDVKEQACICAFAPGHGMIRSLSFAGGANSTCIAIAHSGSIIRLWKAKGSSDFACETIGEAAGRRGGYNPRAVFSICGSFLATIMNSYGENASTLALYELGTMTKTQSVLIPGMSACCFAVSPDSKQLVVGDYMGRIRLVPTDDLSNQSELNTRRRSSKTAVFSVAFDPTCRVLAFGCRDGSLELRTL